MGLAEDRVGYLEGGGEGRWTIRSPEEVEGSYVYLSTSSRVAGAIDSLVWRDKEFINGWDHGRQLQCAVTVRLLHLNSHIASKLLLSLDIINKTGHYISPNS